MSLRPLRMTDHRLYFDTSALVKVLLPREAGADVATAIFNMGVPQYSSLLSRPETLSALARRFRNRELNPSQLSDARLWFREVWSQINVIPVDNPYVNLAAELVDQYPLSGADAVHLATAVSLVTDSQLTFVTWDRRQAEAAAELGFTVQPPIDRQTVA